MRRYHWIALLALSSFFGSVAIAQQKPAAPATPAAAAAPAAVGYATNFSIQELMLSIVDPVGDAIFDSVSVSITAAGSKETRPRTDAEWLAVRDKAVQLAEAGNLLKIPGRRVGPAAPIRGLKPETPGPDDLSPAQVEILLKQNRAPFNAFAQKLTDAAMVALKAVDSRSVDGLYEAGDAIDQACENCHLNYWYPGPNSPVRKALK
jgi:NADPH-dependent glutamate synthase beta subunit-like oxidoreductase